jgi:hypothetical protein
MKLPNFFIVGAPRCGTTALSRYLAAHPQICFSRPKESHYLLHRHRQVSRNEWMRRYIDQFFGHCQSHHQAVGEGSVSYLYSPIAIRRILRLNPHAKFIVAVRNPLDLLPSYHLRMRYLMQEDREDFQTAWQLQKRRLQGEEIPPFCRDRRLLQYTEVGKVGKYLERLIKMVGRDRCLILVFDDLMNHPQQVYQQVCHFLGVEDDGRTEFPATQVSRFYRYAWFQRLLFHPPAFLMSLASRSSFKSPWMQWNRLIALRLHRWLLQINSFPSKPPSLTPQMKAQLRATYASDVERLSDLLGRDLSHWIRTPVRIQSSWNPHTAKDLIG